jgi:4,5-dihydroxyphthalate decarboxylase
MTAAIWIRGILHHHYGVDLSGIEWVEGAIDGPHPHGKPTILPPLKPIKIVQNESGKSLSELLEAGDIVATIGADLPPAFGRNPNVDRLFPDFRQAEKDYYKATGIFPIMHLIVVRRDVLEKHPFIASSLYQAFCESKSLAYKRMRYLGALRYMLPWLAADLEEIQEAFGGDPWPYGVEPNRKAMEALVQYLVDQSMIAKPVPVDDLFARVFDRTETPKHPTKA